MSRHFTFIIFIMFSTSSIAEDVYCPASLWVSQGNVHRCDVGYETTPPSVEAHQLTAPVITYGTQGFRVKSDFSQTTFSNYVPQNQPTTEFTDADVAWLISYTMVGASFLFGMMSLVRFF